MHVLLLCYMFERIDIIFIVKYYSSLSIWNPTITYQRKPLWSLQSDQSLHLLCNFTDLNKHDRLYVLILFRIGITMKKVPILIWCGQSASLFITTVLKIWKPRLHVCMNTYIHVRSKLNLTLISQIYLQRSTLPEGVWS